MILHIDRAWKSQTYTLSRLRIDGVLFWNALEDTDRGLKDSMKLSEILKIKIKGETAIPSGLYKIDMDTVSPKYSNYMKYSWAKKYNGKIPRLLNVKGYEGVLIHPGNTPEDSFGCILVGKNIIKGKVTSSVAIWEQLMHSYLLPAHERKEEIYIQID